MAADGLFPMGMPGAHGFAGKGIAVFLDVAFQGVQGFGYIKATRIRHFVRVALLGGCWSASLLRESLKQVVSRLSFYKLCPSFLPACGFPFEDVQAGRPVLAVDFGLVGIALQD